MGASEHRCKNMNNKLQFLLQIRVIRLELLRKHGINVAVQPYL